MQKSVQVGIHLLVANLGSSEPSREGCGFDRRRYPLGVRHVRQAHAHSSVVERCYVGRGAYSDGTKAGAIFSILNGVTIPMNTLLAGFAWRPVSVEGPTVGRHRNFDPIVESLKAVAYA